MDKPLWAVWYYKEPGDTAQLRTTPATEYECRMTAFVLRRAGYFTSKPFPVSAPPASGWAPGIGR